MEHRAKIFLAKNKDNIQRLPDHLFLGYQDLEFFKDIQSLTDAQIGYAVSPEGIADTEWDGNWIVIGRNIMIGDPIFVLLSRKELPVYTAAHGQGWWMPDKIAESLSSFVNSIAVVGSATDNRTNPALLEANPLHETEKAALLQRIQMLNQLEEYSFWLNLLEG